MLVSSSRLRSTLLLIGIAIVNNKNIDQQNNKTPTSTQDETRAPRYVYFGVETGDSDGTLPRNEHGHVRVPAVSMDDPEIAKLPWNLRLLLEACSFPMTPREKNK